MNRLQILTGDCRDILPTLEPESVQCCVTSPPYWGLRDYGTGQWEGGEAGCEHIPDAETLERQNGRASTLVGTTTTQKMAAIARYECKCGARRIDSQLGLESTPEEYIAEMVAVFREVWRALKPDATLWVNMGDSYAGGGTIGRNDASRLSDGLAGGHGGGTTAPRMGNHSARAKGTTGLKPKDLCMMPARLAMALQADGWYLRSEIVWAKPNPMPESVTDRPTKAHEMIYLLAKQERYFYDAEAIREPGQEYGERKPKASRDESAMDLGQIWNQFRTYSGTNEAGRNKRTVWTIATQPYAEAHFATFPEEIPKLCILAGSKPGDTVLDPFAGSGTVGQVALELGRRAILIELNPAYIELAEDRTFVTPGFL
jgi:DNA modification methylase